MNRNLRGQFASKRKSINSYVTSVIWERMKIVGMIFVFAFAVSAWTVSNQSPKQAEAETKIVTVEAPQVDPPVMVRIAHCESSTGMKGKSGQVQVKVNTNGTVDVGKFQINSVHFAEASKLGYDVFTEKGNHDYAKYLYENFGTGAWASSANCWNK